MSHTAGSAPASSNPYDSDLGGRDSIEALSETPEVIRRLIEGWGQQTFWRSYAPGKWNAARLLLHLAQTEMVLGTRIRMALTTKEYIVQPFEQDDWIRIEPAVEGRVAFDSYYAQRQMSLPLFRSLTSDQLKQSFRHPERGTIDVQWLLEMLAGHEIHHLPHFREIDRQSKSQQ